MATKVYLSGKNIIVDQDGQSLLTIRTDRARYSVLTPFVSLDGKNPVSTYIEFKDVKFLTIRTELISNVQDGSGSSFADLYYLLEYLQGFFIKGNGDTVYENPAITYLDSPNIDAFGRLRTSGTGQRLDAEFIYNKQDDLFDEIIIGGATVTHQVFSRDLLLEINSTTNSDSAAMASYPVPYTPGNSQFVAMTGTINEANIAGGNAEVFLRSTVSGVLVETVYDQADWNANTLSDVDWTKSQIFEIDFQSLKVGRIRFALNRGGVIIPFHTIANDNIRNTGYWQHPSLPVTWRIHNDATYTYCEMAYGNTGNGIGIRYKVPVNAGAQLRAICATVKSEGGPNVEDIKGFRRKADMGTTKKTVKNSLVPILSIRPKTAYNSLSNYGLVLPLSIGFSTDNPIRLVVIHDAILTGASWTDVDTAESCVEYDVSASSYSNGHEVFSDYISTPKNTASSQDSILGKTLLWNKQGTRTGILTICAERNTNTNADVFASLRFREIR